MTPEQLAKMLYRQNGYMDMPDEVLILTNQAADMLLKQQATIDKLLVHCDDPECWDCGKIICPHEDEMHFHHDGCPSCSEENEL